ncbi:Hypothetical Protein FCC1311_015392 [Hondaea fermentalgiana]|uniref:Nuclear control of ATPase protein 2 n=1 Tax=Hondaea fermentalgiana TaxID=2315210 RepID=A0A2R5GB24_9STRA|nr:Hypothetical Protein FCC1311_015392 [Hondaea fermentalgiana]|eukprot:GBG25321.1 Hypothetical Protein FCC1311_015392 [Hondaea fermentalgiana]
MEREAAARVLEALEQRQSPPLLARRLATLAPKASWVRFVEAQRGIARDEAHEDEHENGHEDEHKQHGTFRSSLYRRRGGRGKGTQILDEDDALERAVVGMQHRVSMSIWAAVLVCELTSLKTFLCGVLDVGSAQLGFWRDIAERPMRSSILRMAARPVPDLDALEVSLLVLMEALGDCELALRRIAQHWAQASPRRRRSIVRRILILELRICKLDGVSGSGVGDAEKQLACLESHVPFVRRTLPQCPATWSALWITCRDKASAWINKKILTHVTSPTQNLINELINFRELEARIEIFNKDDELALNECQLRLQELFAAETAQRAASKSPSAAALPPNAATARLSGKDLAQFTSAHEAFVRNPHRAILGGTRAMRPLLVNLYFVKAEIYYVLKAMHVLNRGSNFHFEMMAMVPAILAFRGIFRGLRTLLFSGGRHKISRSGHAIAKRLQYTLRDLEQLANRGAHIGDEAASLGRFLMLSHQLQVTVAEHLEPTMHTGERLRLKAFWRALASFSATTHAHDGLLGRFLMVLDDPAP